MGPGGGTGDTNPAVPPTDGDQAQDSGNVTTTSQMSPSREGKDQGLGPPPPPQSSPGGAQEAEHLLHHCPQGQ